jgi:DNA-binding beta-propeller fold protein YncE
VDLSGKVYIADEGNNKIRRVDPSAGIITTVAGTGVPGFSGDGEAAAAAQLDSPSDVVVDPATGDLFIADFRNNRIRRIPRVVDFP